MRVHVKSWTMAAYWSWENTHSDTCGICQLAFDACCPQCTVPGDDCPLLWGECSHVFHMHCIMKWLSTTPHEAHCPLDRLPWKNKPKPASFECP
ncbi:anaphase-promoting complex subunit 11 [Spinellus fusiger]|nr:anaphase-promoting complex subunit 11 [Spinellus fusiger]